MTGGAAGLDNEGWDGETWDAMVFLEPFHSIPAMSPPSVYDTHCSGPGGLSSTPIWGSLRRKYWQYFSEDAANHDLPPKQDLSGKNVIVTGSNSGIGKEAAYIFALWGANVIMACRNPPPSSAEQHPTVAIKELLQRSQGSISEDRLTWWEVDFANLQSIKDFGKRWKDSGKVCDILCNNAGMGGVDGRIITKDGHEIVNQVNFLSHCLLTLYVLPSMKKVSRCGLPLHSFSRARAQRAPFPALPAVTGSTNCKHDVHLPFRW